MQLNNASAQMTNARNFELISLASLPKYYIFSHFGSVKKGAINSFRYHLTFHEHHQIYLLVRYKVPSISVCSCNANLH